MNFFNALNIYESIKKTHTVGVLFIMFKRALNIIWIAVLALSTIKIASAIPNTSTGIKAADRMLLSARIALGESNASQAIDILKQVINKYPNTKAEARAWVWLAKIIAATDLSAAKSIYQNIIANTINLAPEIQAEAACAQYELAMLEVSAKNYEAAITEFQKVLYYCEVDEPGEDGAKPSEWAAFQIALCYKMLGDEAFAVSLLNKFIQDHQDCYLSFRAAEKLEDWGIYTAYTAGWRAKGR